MPSPKKPHHPRPTPREKYLGKVSELLGANYRSIKSFGYLHEKPGLHGIKEVARDTAHFEWLRGKGSASKWDQLIPYARARIAKRLINGIKEWAEQQGWGFRLAGEENKENRHRGGKKQIISVIGRLEHEIQQNELEMRELSKRMKWTERPGESEMTWNHIQRLANANSIFRGVIHGIKKGEFRF